MLAKSNRNHTRRRQRIKFKPIQLHSAQQMQFLRFSGKRGQVSARSKKRTRLRSPYNAKKITPFLLQQERALG